MLVVVGVTGGLDQIIWRTLLQHRIPPNDGQGLRLVLLRGRRGGVPRDRSDYLVCGRMYRKELENPWTASLHRRGPKPELGL